MEIPILEDDKSLPGVEPDESFYAAFHLVSQAAYGNAIYAVLQLRIPNILAKAEEEGKRALTAEYILKQLPTKSKPGSNASRNLIRLLRPCVRHGLLKESLDDQKQPFYSLTNIARWFVRGKVCNLLDLAGLLADPDFQSAYHHLPDFILDETIVPFDESQKLNIWDKVEDDANFGDMLHRAMAGLTNVEFAGLLDGLRQCGALDDVKTVVEVGGGVGTAVAALVARSPKVKGINFDRPDVIAMSPKHERVDNVGGNFLESVPCGELMLLKYASRVFSFCWGAFFIPWSRDKLKGNGGLVSDELGAKAQLQILNERTLWDYGDEDVVRILRSCFRALPKKGKVIIAEYLVKDWHDTSTKADFCIGMDLFMMISLKGGLVRSGVDHKGLLETAGFSGVELIELPGCMDLVQAFKI